MTTPETERSDGAASKADKPSQSPLTYLTLLIALAAALIGGWSAWQLQTLRYLPEQLSGRESDLGEMRVHLRTLSNELERQLQITTRLDEEVQSRSAAFEEFEALQLRLAQVESTLESIPGISPRARASWLITEALYYMRVANAQALLAGDPQIAASALELADEKLRDSKDPSMAPVRAELAQEIAQLRAMPDVDRVGISAQLRAITRAVETFPFRSIAPDSFEPELSLDEVEAELGPWERFVETLKEVFGTIVSVKESESPPIAQLGIAERSLIVESVRAELKVARLSFASGNSQLFTEALDRATQEIELYFDVEDSAVATALQTITDIQQIEMPGPMPDISRSLALLLSATEKQAAQSE